MAAEVISYEYLKGDRKEKDKIGELLFMRRQLETARKKYFTENIIMIRWFNKVCFWPLFSGFLPKI